MKEQKTVYIHPKRFHADLICVQSGRKTEYTRQRSGWCHLELLRIQLNRSEIFGAALVPEFGQEYFFLHRTAPAQEFQQRIYQLFAFTRRL